MEHMKMTDMARSSQQKAEAAMPQAVANQPDYPYGLCIRLTKDELDKLNVDHTDWQVGDMFHLHALAKITSISARETSDGGDCCVELQITHLDAESEDEENEEMEEQKPEEKSEEEMPAKKSKPNFYF